MLKDFLEAGYVDNGVFHNTSEGTPQGGLLSPLLANIALHGMEEVLGIYYVRYENKRGITYASRGKYRMVRYADDFLIFAQSKEDILKIRDILQPYLDERGLILAEDKTFIKHISEGFDFVGFVRRARGFIPHTVSVKQFVSIPVALGFSPMKLLIE